MIMDNLITGQPYRFKDEQEQQTAPEDTPNVNEWTSKIGDSTKQEKYVKQGFLRKIKKHAKKIPFAKHAVAMYYCAIDANTPTSAKVIAVGALAYILMPIDLIPDFVLGIGYTDDAAAFWAAYRSISMHVTDAHSEMAEQWFAK